MKDPPRFEEPPAGAPPPVSGTTTLMEPPENRRPPGGMTRPAAADGGHLAPGTRLAGRYRILSFLGRGGMGDVYHAEDTTLGVSVALKFLLRARPGRARLELLLNEVRLARQISHPNVCRVHDVVEVGGMHFLAMEYIDGEDLRALLRRIGRLPQERALALAIEVCRGLEAAHERGILHRDLKPANLMLDSSGDVRITDFGLAWTSGCGNGSTPSPGSSDSVRCGTPAYMAPEQRTGREATVRSDLYSLGLVFYEMFTGHRALAEAAPGTVTPPPPSRWVEGLDPGVEKVILRCLAAAPDERPASAREIAVALERRAAAPWRPAAGLGVPYRPSWELLEKLGRGGSGEAWLAVHRKTREKRVFKFCFDAAQLPALQRETTLFRLLKEQLGERDDVARILDWSFEDPPWYLESEWTNGGSLVDWAEAAGGLARVPLAERLEIVAQVATALAAAHSIGVLHKDVKPANVLVRDDAEGRVRTRLADFGVGTLVERERLAEAGITAAGFTAPGVTRTLAGTRLYMAPELLEGKPATLQSDVYALGVLLYQMVVGDLTRALATGWQRDVGDGLLREDLEQAVDGSPERRLRNALRLAESLRRLDERRAEREAERRARREAEATRAALEKSRRRRRVGLVVLAAALLAAAGTFLQARRSAREAAWTMNVARVAVAGEWLAKDPTRAALVLYEVDDPRTPFTASKMGQALRRPLTYLELRHQNRIHQSGWNDDGTRVATSSEDGTARIWDALTGRLLHVLEGHDGVVYQAVWSGDGKRLATGGRDGTVRVWDPVDPERSLVLDGHTEGIIQVAWSGDGKRLASASADGTARVWDSRGGRQLHVLEGHTWMVYRVAWSGDGSRVATASYDGTARVWYLDADPPTYRSLPHGGRVWSVAWSGDGRRVVTASEDFKVRVWNAGRDAAAEPVVLTGHRGAARVAAWSPGGAYLASASFDGDVLVWPGNPSGDEEPLVLRGQEGSLWSLSWSAGGERLAAFGEEGSVRVWSLGGRQGSWPPAEVSSVVLRGHRGAGWVHWSPEGTRLLSGSYDGTARIWHLGSAAAELTLDHRGSAVHAIAWSHGGDRVATAADDGTLRLWPAAEPRGGEPRAEATPVVFTGHEKRIFEARWSPDDRLVATASGDRTVRLWPVDGGEPVVLTGHEAAVRHVRWSAGGRSLLSASDDGTARVWNVEEAGRREPLVLAGHPGRVRLGGWSGDGRRVLTLGGNAAYAWSLDERGADGTLRPLLFEGHEDTVRQGAWSPDGRRFATVSLDSTARVWDAGDPSRPAAVLTNEPVKSPAWAVTWSPDGRFLLTGTVDGWVRIWRATPEVSEVPWRVLRGHHIGVRRIVWSGDGRSFATSALEGRALVWSWDEVLRSGQGRIRPRTTLEGHTNRISEIAWGRGGRRLATSSEDGTARIWQLETEDLRQRLRAATRMCLDPEFREDVLGESPREARRRFAECEAARGRV